MANPKRKNTVQSLDRGIEVLNAVSLADRPVGITDLSRELGLAKGSIARLVNTLAQHGFLVQDPQTSAVGDHPQAPAVGLGTRRSVPRAGWL